MTKMGLRVEPIEDEEEIDGERSKGSKRMLSKTKECGSREGSSLCIYRIAR